MRDHEIATLQERPLGDAGFSWEAAMRAGDFARAWAISDAVLRARVLETRDDPALPYHLRWVWNGAPLAGKRVLVRCYHGLGDTIQFSRYLFKAHAIARDLAVEVQAGLLPLLAPCFPEIRFLPFDPAKPLPPADCDIEIMELAHALRAAPFHCPSPYLFVPPEANRSDVRAIRAGLCWRAGEWNSRRSITLAELMPYCSLPNLQLLSLQHGPGEQEAAQFAQISDPPKSSEDVRATAALIAGLDLVITVDTMVAHLAGALGRPTCLLLPAEADWRWMESGSRTPWYPSIQLFRQHIQGDWRAPLEALRLRLQAGG